MDIDIQTILQQDIDLGIEKSLCYDFEKGIFTANKQLERKGHDFYKETDLAINDQRLENEKNLDIISASNFFQNQITVPDGYKLILEEDTGEWFLTMIQGDGPNKTNSSLPLNYEEPIDVLNSTKNDSLNLVKKNLEPTENCVKCQVSVFLNNDIVQEVYKIDSNSSQADLLTPPRSDDEYSSSSNTNEELEQLIIRPNFLSLQSVNQELSKLNENQEVAFSEIVNISSIGLQQNENVSRVDDLLLLNETWVSNYFTNEPNTLTTNETPSEAFTINNNQLNNQLININNNQSLQRMNNNESLFTTQEDQFEFIFNNSQLQQQQPNEPVIIQNEQINTETNTNLTSIDNFLMSDDFLKHIEENIESFEKKPENFDSFDFMLNQDFAKNDELKTVGSSQLFSNPNLNLDTPLNSANMNFNFQTKNSNLYNSRNEIELYEKVADINDKAKNINNSNFEILFKQEKVDQDNEQNIKIVDETTSTLSSILPKINRTAALQGLKHNHTYLDGAETESDSYHPYSYKNKLKKMLKNLRNQNENQSGNVSRQYESRDELLLRENNIQLTLSQVVDTNAEDFNELLKANSNLSQDQVNLIKDIRRRGKNKVAAQICRKRKIDSIDSLKEDVQNLNEMKSMLQTENEMIYKEIQEMTSKFDALYKDTIGNSAESDDPIIMFINNLKNQLNSAKFTSGDKTFNSEESDSRGSDDSYNDSDRQERQHDDLDSSFSDDDEDENDSDEVDYQKTKYNNNNNKKFKKF